MATLNTDAAVLSREAGNFERIAGELKTVIGQVDATAGALAGSWHGMSGGAAQAALARFQHAGTAQITELNDISQNIQTAGIQYTSTDDDGHAALSTAMQF